MGNYHFFLHFKAHKHWANNIVLKTNKKEIVLKLDLQKKKRKKKGIQKEKRENLHKCQVWALVATSSLVGASLAGAFSRVSILVVVSGHLLVNLFQVQFLQLHSERMLGKVPPQKLKTFEVLVE